MRVGLVLCLFMLDKGFLHILLIFFVELMLLDGLLKTRGHVDDVARRMHGSIARLACQVSESGQ